MTVLYSQTITTPLGQMLIAASTRGVCLAEFAGTPRMERESRNFGAAVSGAYRSGRK